MNTPAPVQQLRETLIAEIAALAGSFEDFRSALHGVNDPMLLDAFSEVLRVGPAVIEFHRARPGTSIADDMANLRSQFSRHPVPREDHELGRLESLTRLRGARGLALADIDTVLDAARTLGLTPSEALFPLPTAVEFERAGFEGQMAGLAKRLDAVEMALNAIAPEGASNAGHSAQQIGLVNFYVHGMTVELALARLEATAKAVVDFASLGRAAETMAELTRDFVATVEGMRRKVSESLQLAAAKIRPAVRRVVRGVRAIARRVGKREAIKAEAISARQTTEQRGDDALFWSLIADGDAAIRAGVLRGAREAYGQASAIALELITDAPANIRWQRDLSVSHNRLGDVAVAAGDLGEARRRFEAGLAIAEWLAAQEPGNAEWQRDLSVSHNKLGDVAEVAGDLGEAQRRFGAGLAIRERLAAQEPGNAEWQRDLSVSHNKLGNVAEVAGDLGEARRRFEASLAIRDGLAIQEPDNIGRQRDLSVSHSNLGDVAMAAGDLGEARRRFEASLAIGERLVVQEPDNIGRQRDLSVSYSKLGNVAVAAGDFGEARRRFEADLAIAERLAAQEPDNAGWQRDLSVSHSKLGDVAAAAGDLEEARRRCEADLAIAERLAAQEPDNAGWQRDAFASHVKLGQAALAAGSSEDALREFRVAETIIQRLVKRWPDHPGFVRDLSAVRSIVAQLTAGEPPPA